MKKSKKEENEFLEFLEQSPILDEEDLRGFYLFRIKEIDQIKFFQVFLPLTVLVLTVIYWLKPTMLSISVIGSCIFLLIFIRFLPHILAITLKEMTEDYIEAKNYLKEKMKCQ